MVLQTLHATIQDRVKPGGDRTHVFRLWPRDRRKASNEHDMNLNFHCRLFEEYPEDFYRSILARLCGAGASNFIDLYVLVMKRLPGISCWQFLKRVCAGEFIPGIALHLVNRHARFRYQWIWNTKRATHVSLAVCYFSLPFPRMQARRVQLKVGRFLNTSPMMGTSCFIFRVATRSSTCIDLAKICLHTVLRCIEIIHLYLAAYLRYHAKVVQIKGPLHANKPDSHIQTAR